MTSHPSAITKVIQWAITYMGSLIKEIADIKKNQMEILELKNILTEIINSVNELNYRMEETGNNQYPWRYNRNYTM